MPQSVRALYLAEPPHLRAQNRQSKPCQRAQTAHTAKGVQIPAFCEKRVSLSSPRCRWSRWGQRACGIDDGHAAGCPALSQNRRFPDLTKLSAGLRRRASRLVPISMPACALSPTTPPRGSWKRYFCKGRQAMATVWQKLLCRLTPNGRPHQGGEDFWNDMV